MSADLLPLEAWVIAIFAGFVLLAGMLYAVSRYLEKREPYRTFLKLRAREKVRFFKLLVRDTRVPWRVKVLPVLMLPYLAMPFDLIPDFIPLLGYVDDVALVLGVFALIMRLTPRLVVDDLFRLAVDNPSPI